FPKVHVIQGAVPESFSQGMPEKISFLHIDMNNADAEVGALEQLFDRVVDGAVILFDDYGWLGYREQKVAEDAFMAARGYQIVELPTGQGMVIK
ncbi:MAG: TylF/MycF/NovP-related O-methyltransferase, partial [Pseudomonadota bacterium]